MWAAVLLMALCCAWLPTAQAKECYKEETLLEDEALGEGLAVDWNTNTVYLVKYRAESGSEVGTWEPARKAYSVLGQLPGRCALALDRRHGRVLAGCRDGAGGGLYIYDRHPQQFVPLTGRVEPVDWVHFADKLYYSSAGRLHWYAHGLTQLEPALQDSVMSFAVDARGGWVYTRDRRAYVARAGAAAVQLAPYKYVATLAVGPRGHVYAGDFNSGVYRLDAAANSLRKVLDTAHHCVSLALDKNDNFVCLIYQSPSRLVRYSRCAP